MVLTTWHSELFHHDLSGVPREGADICIMTVNGLMSDFGVILRNNWDIYSRVPLNKTFNAGYVIKNAMTE